MKVYLAGEQFMGVEDMVDRRLFSYWYHRKNAATIIDWHKKGVDMFLDSGAFSAFTQGVDISIEDFAAFIHDHGDKFTTISSLDDTSKNEQKSWDNQQALESLGCKVQPVFHAREDTRWLVKYIDAGYDYIFLGGMVPESTPWLKEWLDNLWANYLINSDGTPRVKVHGFGLTDQQLMFRYPWHSVDSTSWLFTGSFGACIFIIDGKAHKIVFSHNSPSRNKLNAPHYDNLPELMKAYVDEQLVQFDVTAEECAEAYYYRNKVNVRAFKAMEELGITKFIKEQETFFK
jgi:hypothetical protein